MPRFPNKRHWVWRVQQGTKAQITICLATVADILDDASSLVVVSSRLCFQAAIKGEEWKPVGLDKKRETSATPKIVTSEPPSHPPPRAPVKRGALDNKEGTYYWLDAMVDADKCLVMSLVLLCPQSELCPSVIFIHPREKRSNCSKVVLHWSVFTGFEVLRTSWWEELLQTAPVVHAILLDDCWQAFAVLVFCPVHQLCCCQCLFVSVQTCWCILVLMFPHLRCARSQIQPTYLKWKCSL